MLFMGETLLRAGKTCLSLVDIDSRIHGNEMVEPTMEDPITEDILIVGSGPAGASLACFLAFYGNISYTANFRCRLTINIGLKGIIVGAGSSTADTPRAHITNMAAMGLYQGYIYFDLT